MSTQEQIQLDEGFLLIRIENDSDEVQVFEKHVELGLIQFHFNVKGKGKFIFNNGNYQLDLNEEKALLLFNPQKELPLHLEVQPKSWIISIIISVQKFHALFASESEVVPFLTPENLDKKYYGEESISPSMAIVLNQLFHYKQNTSIKNLYIKGKSYELLSLFFNTSDDPNVEHCPFLIDEANIQKIKKAKEILLDNMIEPIGLNELADQVGISLKKLKEGFKHFYHDTPYNYLLNYKLEIARGMLDDGIHNVNEIGLKIGYSTSSHFIAAFKKKYGTTPKKYLTEIQNKKS